MPRYSCHRVQSKVLLWQRFDAEPPCVELGRMDKMFIDVNCVPLMLYGCGMKVSAPTHSPKRTRLAAVLALHRRAHLYRIAVSAGLSLTIALAMILQLFTSLRQPALL